MKKIMTLWVVAVLCAAVSLAGDEKMGDKRPMGKANEGTITKIDTAGKMMTVKDSAGKETTVYWNDSTKVGGDEMKEGALVHWRGADKDGKMMATWVHVGAMGARKKM
jgi:hypothetical protein